MSESGMRCKLWKTCGKAASCTSAKPHEENDWCKPNKCFDHQPYVDGGVVVFCEPFLGEETEVMAKKSKMQSNVTDVTSPAERLIRVDPKLLQPHSANPRNHINTESQAFKDLLESVRSSGVREHLQVRPIAGNGSYEILSGHRRHAAALEAGLASVPAVVIECSDEEAFKQVFFGNFGREDLTPAEEGRAVEILLEKLHGDRKAAAAALGKSEQWVELRARLQKLTPKWRKAMENPDHSVSFWPVGMLVLIARLDPALQDEVLDNNWRIRDASTVAELDKLINQELLRKLKAAPFSREDALLVKGAGACTDCVKRTSCQGLLFIETEDDAVRKKNDHCLDAKCWDAKVDAWTAKRITDVQEEHGKKPLLLVDGGTDYYEDQKLQKLYGQTTHAYSVSAAKATDEGAVPAVVVHGKGRGELRWVKASGRDTTGRPNNRARPPTLKERRKVLETKRLSMVLERLRETILNLERSALPEIWQSAHGLVELASVFGTHRNNDSLWQDQILADMDEHGHTKNTSAWKQLEETHGLDESPLIDLWYCIRRVLAKRLRTGVPITQTDARYGAEAERVAGLCGIDLAPLRAEAAEVYKEPKAWKNLSADGTKKGKKARGK